MLLNKSQRDFVQFEIAKSVEAMNATLPSDFAFKNLLLGMASPQEIRPDDVENARKKLEEIALPANAIAKAFRQNTRARQFKSLTQLSKEGVVSKAQLDVGTLTNFAQITGGQSLGYVSLDTQMARGTVRPNSFTLYQCLHKTGAYQVVDYWPYASNTGAGLPGTAFQGFGNVSSGTLATSAGKYNLNFINLKLAVNGRSITTALAAQNSFVDVAAQENINAALAVLESVNWSNYWGDPTLFPNQFAGIASGIPAVNTFNFQTWFADVGSANSWSKAQGLYNLIYEASAQITSYQQYGRITHAFMSPTVAGSLQSLVTTLLNNIVTTLTPSQERLTGIVVDGDLQGMRTRFGEIQFPIDLFIDSRDRSAQSWDQVNASEGVTTSYATTTNPTRPVSVVGALNAPTVTGSQWTTSYVASSGLYSYAVASCDASMNESTMTFISSGLGNGSTLTISGVAVGGAYTLTITPPVAADAAVFRVYRSGLGYAPATSGAANPSAYRYIGAVAANGSSTVTFQDLNAHIPGSQTIFLLDLDESDHALDFRYLLPLTKVELFAQNLFMPWAVCMIGAVRLRIPKFHGLITNYIPDQPAWDPLQTNANVT